MKSLAKVMRFCAVVGIGAAITLGQFVPCDSNAVATGESLPQIAVVMITLVLAVGSSLLPNDETAKTLSGETRQVNRYWIATIVALAVLSVSTYCVYGRANLRVALNCYWQWIAHVALAYSLFLTCRSFAQMKTIEAWMLSLAFCIAFHAIYQYAYSMPADRERFANDPIGVLREQNIDAVPGTSTYILFEARLQDMSPTGPFSLTNSLAGFLVPWVVIAFIRALELYHDETRNRSTINLALYTALGVFLSVVLVLTKSRTAWIAACVGIGCALCLEITYSKRWKRYARSIAAIVPAIAFIVLGIVYLWDWKIVFEASQSFAYRIEYWKTTLKIIADNLWLGIGPGNFQSYYAQYKTLGASETVGDPHNYLIEVCAIGGILLLVSVVAGQSILIATLYRRSRQRNRVGYQTTSKNPAPKNTALKNPASLDVINSRPEKRSEVTRKSIDSNRKTGYVTEDIIWRICLLSGGVVAAMMLWGSLGAFGPLPPIDPYLLSFGSVLAMNAASVYLGYNAAKQKSNQKDQNASPVAYDEDDNCVDPTQAYLPALIALLINLLAAGGWMTPGICNTLAVVTGMSLIPFAAQMESFKQLAKKRNPPVNYVLRIAIAVGLPVVFYITMGRPVEDFKLASRELPHELASGSAVDQRNALEELKKLDRYDPDAFRLASFVEWQTALNEIRSLGGVRRAGDWVSWLERAKADTESMVQADRANWQVYAAAGYNYLELATYDLLNAGPVARDYFMAAQSRHPTDVGLMIQVAFVSYLLGDMDTAKTFSERATVVDEMTSHTDRKAYASSIAWPKQLGVPSTISRPSQWTAARRTRGGDSNSDVNSSAVPWVEAEPVLEFLRTITTFDNGK